MKNELKELMLEKRNSLPQAEIFDKSSKIENNLFNMQQYQKSKIVMLFASFGSEVYTHNIIKKSLKTKTVILPKIVHREIEPSIIVDFDSLVPSEKFGMPEPMQIIKIAYKNIDFVIVPGIAFDMHGHRIGYGYGYYDKFLKKVPKAAKIGVCFDFQLVDKIPEEKHDVPVDLIVTEEGVIECGKK